MPLCPHPLDDDLRRDLLGIFPDIDLDVIKNVLYFDGWTSWEESGGCLIFEGIDGSLQKSEFGYCVMDTEHDRPFRCEDVSLVEAECCAMEMDRLIHETNVSMAMEIASTQNVPCRSRRQRR